MRTYFLLLLTCVLAFFAFSRDRGVIGHAPVHRIRVTIQFGFLLALVSTTYLTLAGTSVLRSHCFLIFIPIVSIFIVANTRTILGGVLMHSHCAGKVRDLIKIIAARRGTDPVLRRLGGS